MTATSKMSKEEGDKMAKEALEAGKISKEAFSILRERNTEYPGTGKYEHPEKKTGRFLCALCKAPLFEAKAQFDSGSGWPSFDSQIGDSVNIGRPGDKLEVHCASCGGHQGHRFMGATKADGTPVETGMRYCINSKSIVHEDDVDAAPEGIEEDKKNSSSSKGKK